MNMLLHHLIITAVPLAVSGVIHMIIVKMDILSGLKKPISNKWFGANKTWRGVFVMVALNALMMWFLSVIGNVNVNRPLFLGAMLGLGYIVFELPNSFMKRRLGIRPGGESTENRYLFHLIDKMDSAFGVSLLYFFLGYVDGSMASMIFVFGVGIHLILSMLLYMLRIKKEY